MREPEIISLGEHTYEIKPLSTSAMLKLMTRMARILGPSAAMLDNPADLAKLSNIGRVLADLAERMEEADVLEVCKVLAEHTMILAGDRKLPSRRRRRGLAVGASLPGRPGGPLPLAGQGAGGELRPFGRVAGSGQQANPSPVAAPAA